MAATRVRVEIRGAVQGVGFRPFVYRLARDLGLAGWVSNDPAGVHAELEGERASLEEALRRLENDAPPRAEIHAIEAEWLAPAGLAGFEIRPSAAGGKLAAVVLADGATCADCLAEVLDENDRRYRYPFANCTQCGPRFTIVRGLPYDRPLTTMRDFAMCAACRREYEDPLDRRFHAQPNACPACGPRLRLGEHEGEAALRAAAEALRAGRILALKGLGGYLLLVDARDPAAVARLRERKAREEKPLALLVADLAMARTIVDVPDRAAELLGSVEAPIVLLPRRTGGGIADEVAPGNRNLGVMLPYTPLHHLLAREVGFPLVATSGNRTEEPICTDDADARERLGDIADVFLGHDRPIARHVDDSVVTLLEGQTYPLRRARGYAPLPIRVRRTLPAVLAVGAHLKNTVALGVGDQVFLSQHIGDLETPQARAAFERVIADLLAMYDATPARIAHDLHPDYVSTRWAAAQGLPTVAVQHHHAHLAACLLEHGVEGPALGVVWDGTGYGTDGTVWGGEFLLGDAAGFERVASLRPFTLPGGEAAIREPRRLALALLWELGAHEAWVAAHFTDAERPVLERMLTQRLRCPVTTSAGRLFDGVAALLDVRQRVSFEGQAAMGLEQLADPDAPGAYPLPLRTATEGPATLDWGPLVRSIRDDTRAGVEPAIIAARFHGSLTEGIVAVARSAGAERVALTGGCFQNLLLAERTAGRLRQEGFQVLLHRRVPANDGGISLGQIAVAAATG